MDNYNKNQVSPSDHTQIAIHSILRPEDDHISKCGPNFKKTVLFLDIEHFINEETYLDFDCVIT